MTTRKKPAVVLPPDPPGSEPEITNPERPAARPRRGKARRVRPVLPASPAGEPSPERPSFTVELVGDQVGQAMSQIVEEAQYWINKGRYNKVRITRAGKPLLPDIPVGALLAIEAATFFWAGMLRGVVANIAGNVLFQVELINDAKEHLAKARGHFLDGDLDEAEQEMQAALAIDDRDAEIHVAVGALYKAQRRHPEAIRHFRRARDLDPDGESGIEASRQLEKLGERP